MSGLSALSGGAGLSGPRPDMFKKVDTDESGTISRAEFIAGRPKAVSETDASALFDTIDSDADGALLQEQFEAGPESNRPANGTTFAPGGNIASGLLATLLETVQEAGGALAGSDPSAASGFGGIDSDSDGKVTKAEFVAGRPDSVSESEAGSLFDEIVGDDGDAIDVEQFAGGRPSGPPPGGRPGPPPASSGSDDDETTDELLQDYLDAIEKYSRNAASDGLAAATSQSLAVSV